MRSTKIQSILILNTQTHHEKCTQSWNIFGHGRRPDTDRIMGDTPHPLRAHRGQACGCAPSFVEAQELETNKKTDSTLKNLNKNNQNTTYKQSLFRAKNIKHQPESAQQNHRKDKQRTTNCTNVIKHCDKWESCKVCLTQRFYEDALHFYKHACCKVVAHIRKNVKHIQLEKNSRTWRLHNRIRNTRAWS